MPQPQGPLGAQDEYDRADKVADEVERQLLDFAPGVPADIASGGDRPSQAQVYPSPAVRKPRSFYNYFGDDLIPLLVTDRDETLMRLAGGPGASSAHELFIPLPIQQQQSATCAPIQLDSL